MLIETGNAPDKSKTKGDTEALVVIQIHGPIHQKHDVFRINNNFPVKVGQIDSCSTGKTKKVSTALK